MSNPVEKPSGAVEPKKRSRKPGRNEATDKKTRNRARKGFLPAKARRGKDDPEFLLYVFLKHGFRLPEEFAELRAVDDDPFYAFQEINLSKGRLCELIAQAIVKEILAGGLPGFKVETPKAGKGAA